MVVARRTLLPASSRDGGETTAIPKLAWETAMRPPPTPLCRAGRCDIATCPNTSIQACNGHHARTPGTFSGFMSCLPVTGFLPALASVAAIVARSFAFTFTEHCSV